MAELEVPVYCYWKGCIKYGPQGVYYEGSTPKRIIVNPKIALNRLLDEMYVLTGVDIDKQRTKVKIFGRYPSVVGQSMFQYLLLPVVNNNSLETMLAVPSKHPFIKNVELYLEVKSDEATCSSLLANPCSSSKRQRTDIPIKLESDHSNGNVRLRDGDMTDAVAQVANLKGDSSISHKDLTRDSSFGVSKPCLSSLWLEDHDLRVGLCFKDSDELKKAVNWCSIKGQQKCVVRETGKDECMFECVRWKCKWSIVAARMEKHGLFEIVKYTGPHTCRPCEPKDFKSQFEADEFERVVRVNPTQSFAELNKWWREKSGYELETSEVQGVKEEAIKRVFGDWDQSFEDLPKLMSAFCSSNGLLVDWKYDLFPNPNFASFCGVFWAFSQSVEGFQHCRPLMVVQTKELSVKYQLKLMIASGLDASNNFFPVAFAVTKEALSDSYRWFLNGIREKVTQRKGLCLISSPHPDILTVINEPGSRWQEPWAYHRFCLKQFSFQFCRDFPGYCLESCVKQAGSTSQKDEFETHMETIKKKNPEAWRRLDQIPQNQWSLVYDNGRRYGIMEIDRKALFSHCRGFALADHVVTGSYAATFSPVPELSAWPEASGVPRLFPPVIPPPHRLHLTYQVSPNAKQLLKLIITRRAEKGRSAAEPGILVWICKIICTFGK